MTLLDSAAHSCAFSPDGQMILVGLGLGLGLEDPAAAAAAGLEEERKEGAFIVVSEEDLTLLYEARDSRSAISDIKVPYPTLPLYRPALVSPLYLLDDGNKPLALSLVFAQRREVLHVFSGRLSVCVQHEEVRGQIEVQGPFGQGDARRLLGQ